MSVLNFLYTNSYYYLTLLLSFLYSYCPLITHWAAKLPSQIFFNIPKPNLINILFHKVDFVKNRK